MQIFRNGILIMAGDPTPAELGYRWPAEWEPHAGTWVAWPRNPATWPGKFEVIPGCFAKFVRALARFEPVHILAGGAEIMADARRHVVGLANVHLHDIETNDSWCRDHGPIFLVPHEDRQSLPPALVDWEYNAWGGKYPPFDKDNAVPQQIAELQGRRRFVPGVVLEGGSIEGNGQGTILTTASCLLNPNRNPDMTAGRIERLLSDNLGAKKVVWLARGELDGDDTDGHIDQLARFVNPTTIVVAWEDDPNEINHEPLRVNFEQLQTLTDHSGRSFQVVRLPLPKPKYCDGQRLPACYCNFYIVNGGVIVPQFDDPADARAISILQSLFPEREVIGVDSLDLVWGLGSFHCLTQQEPAAVTRS